MFTPYFTSSIFLRIFFIFSGTKQTIIHKKHHCCPRQTQITAKKQEITHKLIDRGNRCYMEKTEASANTILPYPINLHKLSLHFQDSEH